MWLQCPLGLCLAPMDSLKIRVILTSSLLPFAFIPGLVLIEIAFGLYLLKGTSPLREVVRVHGFREVQGFFKFLNSIADWSTWSTRSIRLLSFRSPTVFGVVTWFTAIEASEGVSSIILCFDRRVRRSRRRGTEIRRSWSEISTTRFI